MEGEIREMVDYYAQKLLNRIMKVRLYGQEIKDGDAAMMLLTAYYLGRDDQINSPMPPYKIEIVESVDENHI
jgi:hypothetical protein